jgi:hypothetical protein
MNQVIAGMDRNSQPQQGCWPRPMRGSAGRVQTVWCGGWRAGVPRSCEIASPQNPTVGPCLGPYGGPRWVGGFLWTRYPCSYAG